MKRPAPLLTALAIWALAVSCQTFGASAEEYYSIGMAYFEMGNYTEAERWLSRARAADRTRTASEYNLGRIAYEAGRYQDAVDSFNRVLSQDPDNVMALRALAYTRIKTGEIEKAEVLYRRVLELIPESLDDGFNHALVLFAMKKYEESEALLLSKEAVIAEHSDMLLLFARVRRALGKVEAVDSYAQWLSENTDPRVRYEYAQTLEKAELFAKALEEYREALTSFPADTKIPGKADVRFDLARVLLVADSENPQGMTELKSALQEGFENREALEALALDDRILESDRAEIRELLRGNLQKSSTGEPEETPAEEPETASQSQEPATP
jgi:tetratricopeptide (TPR) repeat protein